MEQLGRRTRLHSESEASAPGEVGGSKRSDSNRSRTDVRELKTAQNSPVPSTLASPIKSPNYTDTVEEENYTNKSKF